MNSIQSYLRRMHTTPTTKAREFRFPVVREVVPDRHGPSEPPDARTITPAQRRPAAASALARPAAGG